MGNKTIFITEECEEILRKMKIENFDFNFSNFVQLSIMQESEDKISMERIEEKIRDFKIRIHDGEENLEYWEGIKRTHKQEHKDSLKELQEKAKMKEKLDKANEDLKKALQKEIKKQNDH